MNSFLVFICVIFVLFLIFYCLNNTIESYSQRRSPEVEAIIGPNCSIAKQIKNPSQLGVSSGGSFGALISNGRALVTYTNNLISTPNGCNFFVKSGTCDDTSNEPCKGKPRYIYHQGIVDPNNKCLQNIGINAGNGKNSGLVPSMLTNLTAITKTPLGVINALKGNNTKGPSTISTKCVLRTKLVGSINKLVRRQACVPEYNGLENTDC